MVLTHLILNDMVKVKGQISELAICIVDKDELIASRAQLFFSELGKKVCGGGLFCSVGGGGEGEEDMFCSVGAGRGNMFCSVWEGKGRYVLFCVGGEGKICFVLWGRRGRGRYVLFCGGGDVCFVL